MNFWSYLLAGLIAHILADMVAWLAKRINRRR